MYDQFLKKVAILIGLFYEISIVSFLFTGGYNRVVNACNRRFIHCHP